MGDEQKMLAGETGGAILLVDDDTATRLWLGRWLQKAGYTVREAATAAEALQAVTAQRPDLILLDVMLPDLDGLEVTRRLRADPAMSTVPILLITVLDDPGSKVLGLEAGAQECLSKPIDGTELLTRVRTLLRLKRNQEDLLAEKNRTALLYGVSRELSAELDLNRLLARILSLTMAALGSSRGSIILLDEQQRVLRHIYSHQGQIATVGQAVQEHVVRSGLAGWVIEHRQGVILPDARQDPRWVPVPESGYVTRSVLSVPLVHQEQLLGVLTLAHEEADRFSASDLDLLGPIAAMAAVALANARLFGAVKEEHARLEAVLSATADAIVAADHEGSITLMNPAAESVLGLARGEALGKPFEEKVAYPDLVEIFRRARRVGSSVPGELTLPDGRTLYCTISAVSGGREIPGGWVAVMQDITHLKALDRLKSEFVSTVSHDLRTPLATIHGYAEVLTRALGGEERGCAERIRTQAEQMSRLVEELLDLGKIEAGVEAAAIPCSMEEIIGEAMEAVRILADSAGVALRSEIDSLRPVQGNPVRLRQAVDNLLGNALKYTPPGGSIVVRAWEQVGQVMVTVQDSGPGVPRESLPRIFEKFYRVPGTRAGGTGLGLAIVKAVVEQHGGQVWVESEMGRGSTFGFSLPVAR